MTNILKRVLAVLDGTHLMSLGTVDEGGVWVADVVFIHDDSLNIYWISDPECRHSMAILGNSKVAGSITFSTKSKESNFGIQFEGVAEKLIGVQFSLLIKHLTKRNHQIPDISQALKILSGDCWYKITPTKIRLIDEENFGYDAKDLDLK